MTRRSFALLWTLLILCAGPGAVAEEKSRDASRRSTEAQRSDSGSDPEAPDELRPTWYAQALARGPGGLNVTHFWSKGSKLRAETVVAGRKVVTLVNGDWYYAYDATRGLGVQIRRAPEAIAKDAPYRRPFGNEAVKLIRNGAERIREENYHGRDVEVYQITDQMGRRTVWATKDALNIPLRVEMYSRRTASQQSTDYTDWLTGLTLSETYFEVDPNVEIKTYEFDEYMHWMAKTGSLGPVPVLYTDLLRGR